MKADWQVQRTCVPPHKLSRAPQRVSTGRRLFFTLPRDKMRQRQTRGKERIS